MDFSNFSHLHHEAGVMAIFLLLLILDIFTKENKRAWLRPLACVTFGLFTVAGFFFPATGQAFGGMYISTDMTVMMKNILNVATLLIFMQSGEWLRSDKAHLQREGEFYVITLATLLGMYLMISAGNFMMLYISIETASMPMACLAVFNKYKSESAEAGAKYILISALSSGIMMFGLSYLYGMMGSLYFSDMAPLVSMHPMTILGFAFFFTGLAFKISLVPFHLWTADVYEGAPTAITAYLSVVSKAAASFVLLLTLYHVFGNIEVVWHHILYALSIITIMVGNLFAIRQKDIKRFFAFSSISQAGYLMLGVMNGGQMGMSTTVFYMLVYLFSNLAAFGVIAAVENKTGKTNIEAYNGFFKLNPRLAFTMMLAVFSLAGIPPFAGFFSKFFIFAATAAKGDYILLMIALANTVISLYYYLLVVKAMFINPTDAETVGRIKTDGYVKTSLVICMAGIVFLGFFGGIFSHINSL